MSALESTRPVYSWKVQGRFRDHGRICIYIKLSHETRMSMNNIQGKESKEELRFLIP